MKRRAAVLAVCLLLVSGCNQSEDDEPGFDDPSSVATAPSVEGDLPPEGSTPPESDPAASDPAASDPAGSPPPVAEDQQFALADVAEFDGGLQIEVAGTIADQATETMTGAEETEGQIVVASIRIENGTSEPFEAEGVEVSATYGDGSAAPMITDQAGDLLSGFSGPVAVGDEAVIPVGFAIEVKELKKVTIVVDPNDETHDPVSFTGTVKQT